MLNLKYKTSNRKAYQYELHVIPPTNTLVKRALIKQIQSINNDIVFGNSVPLFDGDKTIISPHILPFVNTINITVRNPFYKHVNHQYNDIEFFFCRFIKTDERDIDEVRLLLNRKKNDKSEYTIEELLSLNKLSKSENEEFIEKLQKYYVLLDNHSNRNNDFIKPKINVKNYSNCQFIHLKDYLLKYLELNDIKQLNKGLTMYERKLINIHLKGEYFRVPHQYKYGYYIFNGITTESSRDCTFKIDNEDIKIREYFLLKYNYTIQLDFLPCVIAENGNLFPMELCEIYINDFELNISRKKDTSQLKSVVKKNVPTIKYDRESSKERISKNLDLKFSSKDNGGFWCTFNLLDNDGVSKISNIRFINQLIKCYMNFNRKFRIEGRFFQNKKLDLSDLKKSILVNYLIGCNNLKTYPSLFIFIYSKSTFSLLKEVKNIVDIYLGIPTLFIFKESILSPPVNYLINACKELDFKVNPPKYKLDCKLSLFEETLIVGAYIGKDKFSLTYSFAKGITSYVKKSYDFTECDYYEAINEILSKNGPKHVIMYKFNEAATDDDLKIDCFKIKSSLKKESFHLTYISLSIVSWNEDGIKYESQNKNNIGNQKYDYYVIENEEKYELDLIKAFTKSISETCLDSCLVPHVYYSRLINKQNELLDFIDDQEIYKK